MCRNAGIKPIRGEKVHFCVFSASLPVCVNDVRFVNLEGKTTCKVNTAEAEMPTSVGITSVDRIFIHAALLRVLVLPAYMSLFLWQAPRAACLLTVTADAVPAHQRMRPHLSDRPNHSRLFAVLP